MKKTLTKVKERALAIFYHDLTQQIIVSGMLFMSDPKIRFVLIIVTPGGVLVPTTHILRNPKKAYRQMGVIFGTVRSKLRNFKRKKSGL